MLMCGCSVLTHKPRETESCFPVCKTEMKGFLM